MEHGRARVLRRDGRRGWVILVATAAALTGGGVVAESAFADPASCTSQKPTIQLAIDGTLHGDGYAYCSTSSYRNMSGEIKWDKNFSPDPLVAKTTVSGLQNYTVRVTACDNRNTRSYYARTYFTSTPSHHHDSNHVHLTPNC
jgi:hypothetical protein